MVVHYHKTVWKNCYAEHKVTGETYNQEKKMSKENVSILKKRTLIFNPDSQCFYLNSGVIET